MADFLTIDVVDRPHGGAVRALRRLAALPRPEGCRGLVPVTTGRLVPRYGPAFTPRRMGLVAAWDDEEAADRAALLPRDGRAHAHWHVRGTLAFAGGDGTWRGWRPEPQATRRQDGDDPVLVLISGELRPGYLHRFARDNVGAVRRAEAHPGYLGGLGLFSGPSNTTSCSAWRSAADARAFAFSPGDHRRAVDNGYAARSHRHHRFLRVTPVATWGGLDGRNPFAGLVPEPRARALA